MSLNKWQLPSSLYIPMTMDNTTASQRPDPAGIHPVFAIGNLKNQVLPGSGPQGSRAGQDGNALCFKTHYISPYQASLPSLALKDTGDF